MNLRSVWYLFYLLFFGFYTYKAVRPSAVESIAVEVLPDEHTLGHAGAVPVIRSSRAEQVSNSYNYSVHNFSTTTVIVPPFISSHESLCNTVASLQWIGNPPSQRLILLYTTANESHVTKSNLFRSQPNGSMVNETDQFLQWPNAVIDSFFISNDPNKLLFRDLANHRLYVTVDAGEHYNATQLQFLPSVIQFSHSNADYLFAIDNRSSNLYVSNQLGDSWNIISTAVKAAYWTQLKDGQEFDDPSAIYFAELNEESGGYRIIKVVFPYQNSSIHEFHQDIGEVINFKLAYEYIFVTKNVTNGSTLFVSYKRQQFIQAKFIPAMDGNEHYVIVDASQGQVLLAVFKDSATADLYISDEWGTNYSLSLRNVITNSNLQWNSTIESLDFYIVKGARGTYIANVAVIETQQQSYELTVISFNKGANWSPVTASTLLDSDMLPIECYHPDCSLHLDIHNSGIVSKKSAVGMILARGTLGKGLSQNVGLYLSYDGGFSWRELLKTNATNNTYLFDILDSGSTIIVITGFNYTSYFMISCDTGFTWQTYSTSSDSFTNRTYMPELHTDMSDTASLTMIYGNIHFPFFKHVVLNLNISQLNINECKEADYVTWMPSDGRIGDRCVLGEKVTYHKRKPRHCCRNKPKYWLPLESVMCNCTIEDYGCDIGFERTDYNSPCTPVDGYYPFTPADCTVSNYYSSSNGYRRIAGDTCAPKGNNYFNNELLQPCSDRIFDLYINATPTTAAVDQPITFAITVNGGHQFETTYYFIYGDGSHVIQSTSNTVNHSYSTPGYFTVKVVVSTAAGNSSTTIGVFVEDMIIDASVLVLGSYAPFTYLFAVAVQYKTGVAHYGSTSYDWKFNRFLHLHYIFINTSSPLLNHTFEYAGRYRYRLIVSNAVSTANTEGGFTVVSETGTYASISGPAFDSVNNTVKFDVKFVFSIPSDTIYRWIVINDNDGTVLRNLTSSETTLYIEFNSAGVYDIIVQGWNSQSQIVIFNASTTITIRGLYTLYIIPTSEYIEAGQTVDYALLQLPEVTPEATYTWSWGDNSSDIVGVDHKNQNHTYTFPGPYTISVTAIEYGETFSAQRSMIILDRISRLIISSSSNLVVGIVVTFTARVELQYGTKYFTQVTYQWSYSDGRDSGPIHVFNETGTYLVKCMAISYAESFTNSTSITVEDVVYGLQLMATPSVVAVNQLVKLFVAKGSNMEKYTYSFSFGDMQPSVHNSNGSVIHSYSMPGTYQASVVIQGSGVNVHFKTLVTVYDKISTICVKTFVQSFSVTFIAIIDCEASSDKSYGAIQYTWNFGNGNNVTTYFSSVSTTYQSIGTYSFSVLASNNVSESSYTGQIHIKTETDTTTVQLSIAGPRFALVNNSVMFSVISNVSAIHDLAHIWKIIDQETNQVYANTTGNELVVNFTKPGPYEVLVLVNYNGKIISTSHTINIESKIHYIKVKFPEVIEVNRQTALYTYLYDIHNNSYEGVVNISITQSSILQYVNSPIIIKTYILYSVSSIYEVKVNANNHVSEVSINFTVEVVRTNTTILLEFSFATLSQANVNYESTSWRKLFSDVIDLTLTNESDLPSWQLIATADDVRNKSFLEIFVDVLPMSSSSKALANATTIAEQLIDIVNANYTFPLPNSSSSIAALSATIIGLSHGPTSESPTEGTSSHSYSHTDNNSLELGVGIGVPTIVSVVVSILIGVIYCKRKFYHQRRQYGKLRNSFFINDDVDTGLERTNDIPMDDHELVLEPVTDYEAVTENL